MAQEDPDYGVSPSRDHRERAQHLLDERGGGDLWREPAPPKPIRGEKPAPERPPPRRVSLWALPTVPPLRSNIPVWMIVDAQGDFATLEESRHEAEEWVASQDDPWEFKIKAPFPLIYDD